MVDQPKVITSEVTLDSTHYKEIELSEEGCLKIIVSPKFRELTIDKLINHKDYILSKYDILITSENGKDATAGTGDDGEPGKDGGDFVIRVKDLVSDVIVNIKGADGGDGASGKSSAKQGYKGGNGGKGGDGANVKFYYGHISKNSNGKPNKYPASRGGRGGIGGDGGICLDPIGKGGTQAMDPTEGGSYGKGGFVGSNGKEGSLELIHQDQSHLKALNLSNEEDYNYFLDNFYSEEALKKYPKIWNSIQKSRQNNQDYGLKFDDTTTVETHPITSVLQTDAKLLRSGEKLFNVHINNTINVENSKKSAVQNEENVYPISCTRTVSVYKYNETGKKVYIVEPFTDIYDDQPPFQISDEIETEPILEHYVVDKECKIEVKYVYCLNNGEILPLQPKTFDLTYNRNPLYHHIEITEPVYHGKDPTTGEVKTTGDIKILYGRDTTNPDYTDADFHSGYYESNSYQNGYIPTTIVPIKGKIYFTTETDDFKLDSIDIAYYTDPETGDTYTKPKLSYYKWSTEDPDALLVEMAAKKDLGDKDLAQYFKSNEDFHIDKVENTTILNFDLVLNRYPTSADKGEYDWKSPITQKEFFQADTGTPYAKNSCMLQGVIPITVNYINKKNNKNSNYTFYPAFKAMDSQTKAEHPDIEYFVGKANMTTVYIPRFIVCWGCYAADTQIVTINGVKKAYEIKEGDKIPVYGGKTLTISEVYVGNDKWIYNIKTTDKKSIRVSGGHAMKLYCANNTNGKKISVEDIKKGDLLMTPEKNVEVESVTVEAYNDKVYNFKFKEEQTPNYIEANGFWSGDFVAQNEFEKREQTPEEKEFTTELAQLASEHSKKVRHKF